MTDLTGNQLLRLPRDPVNALRFGLRTLEQDTPLRNLRFREQVAPAIMSGVRAHTIGRMPGLPSSGAGLVRAAHARAHGWPVPVGGSQAIMDAMAVDFTAHGGRIHTGVGVDGLASLPPSRATLLDVSAASLSSIAGDRLPASYRAALRRFLFGDGIAKVDYALSGPVPWTNEEARCTGTLHFGGARAVIARSEGQVADGRRPDDP
ncbi:MAG: hypothetical protein Q7T71_05220 [Herbiconiux sp.]|nr:hypothetical protein [Herbiconiux sp.]